MKKSFAIAAFVAGLFCAMSAQASALYWQVDQEEGRTFQYAQLKVISTGADPSTATVIDMAEAEGDPSKVTLTNTELGKYAKNGYCFFVEMVNYVDGNWTTVDTGYTYGYGDLVSSGYIATGAIDSSNMSTATAVNMGSAVPEPSSGLLLLMGGAMLALRRRRQK